MLYALCPYFLQVIQHMFEEPSKEMKTEQQYLEAVKQLLTMKPDRGAAYNNDFILALAFNGLMLLQVGTHMDYRIFSHYIGAPSPEPEPGNKLPAWYPSYIVDFDWQDHVRPIEKFSFTPLKR